MVNVKALTWPVGIIRITAVILSCLAFSLVASAGYVSSPYWAWCMFTWCFCFFFTFLILILEFTTLNEKLPFCWDNFTAAFVMLASMMCQAACTIYPMFFACNICYRQIAASVMAALCAVMYYGEMRQKGFAEQNSSFFSKFPGKMKMVETFFPCLIFISLEKDQYFTSPGLQWCVAVYSLCFIFAVLIILITIADLTSIFPFCFDKLVLIYNVSALLLYMSAMVIWPLYTLHKGPINFIYPWLKLVVVTVMTVLNFIAYTLDTAYFIRRIFFVDNQ
ncbi:myeloid-associated differentiation marker homolog [Thunnus thynnus]|uniref:myeloid-associated differentiation marker homolog n=1 Tax=Thunnus thynnus TaxID=8237 RepID=UPI0035271A65